jgi:iron complex transport system substrate-binding protein
MRWRLRIYEIAAALIITLFAFGWSTIVRSADQVRPRIVSIGGDITEILYQLGMADRIVAVDTTSQYPPDALQSKPNVGYMRALSIEGVLSMRPTQIIASSNAGPAEVVANLRNSSIDYKQIEAPVSPEGVIKKIEEIGRLVDAEDLAGRLAKSIEDKFATLSQARAAQPLRKSVLFIMASQGGRMTVGGKGSSADAIIELAGAVNAAVGVQGFKPISEEQIVQLSPDAIVSLRRGASQPSATPALLQNKAIAATKAGRTNAVIEMDSLYLLSFGPRTPDAARDLMVALYGDTSQTQPRGSP